MYYVRFAVNLLMQQFVCGGHSQSQLFLRLVPHVQTMYLHNRMSSGFVGADTSCHVFSFCFWSCFFDFAISPFSTDDGRTYFEDIWIMIRYGISKCSNLVDCMLPGQLSHVLSLAIAPCIGIDYSNDVP